MFGSFKKVKPIEPRITPEDKDWVEKNFHWFIEAFGLEKIVREPFILPTPENFPYSDLNDPDQFQELFEQLCQYWQVDPNEIQVKFFDDIKSKQWSSWYPIGKIKSAAGLYDQLYTTEQKRFRIQLAKSNLNHPQLLVATLSHELGHVKLLGGNYLNPNDPGMEPFTDLTNIYFGFGIFVSNTCETRDQNWLGRTGYLPNQVISYATALICYITNKPASDYIDYFNSNTRELFQQDYEYLVKTSDTLLTRDKVKNADELFKINKKISEAFKTRQFEDAIEGSRLLLEVNPKINAAHAYNSIGYALLLQKNYHEAIDAFNQAIDKDPFWDYPFNNRGYCKLQLGELDDAFVDLESSYEMNPHNSFSWRNLGAYYLKVDELEKALHYFEGAEKMDPKTELINFYLGHTHLKLGNMDKAKYYLSKSKELGEYNDSVID